MHSCLCGCGLPLGFLCPCCKAPLDLRMLNRDDAPDWQPKDVNNRVNCLILHDNHKLLVLKMSVVMGQAAEVNERGLPRDAEELGRLVARWDVKEKREWWDDVVRKMS